MTDGLRENLTKVFMLPDSAVEWLMMVYDAIQVFDDVADGVFSRALGVCAALYRAAVDAYGVHLASLAASMASAIL